MGAYARHLDPDEHQPGKRHTQQIERKHVTLRTRITRLTRKTICFSRSTQRHDLVIGLLVNRYEFGPPVRNCKVQICNTTPDVVRETFIVEDVHFLLPASLLAHLIHVYRRCVVTAGLSAQLVQERHGFLEVRRVKPLGEPAINRGEELAGLSRLALLLPEAGQAHGSP